mmetsp:Transcript_26668/g.19996  ORF Transcript_26668/g.19996 Transcript_26668/m.19996 type:complete len:144 (+) Transcript_26668:397-828(+)
MEDWEVEMGCGDFCLIRSLFGIPYIETINRIYKEPVTFYRCLNHEAHEYRKNVTTLRVYGFLGLFIGTVFTSWPFFSELDWICLIRTLLLNNIFLMVYIFAFIAAIFFFTLEIAIAQFAYKPSQSLLLVCLSACAALILFFPY